MGFTIVLGLTVLSLANFGNTFEFSGLDPSFHSKGQFKPTVKPFTAFTNPPQAKSLFGLKTVTPKPFGAPFEPFKPAYQPGPFKTNYQPFGPFPGYPGPVVYHGHGGYQGPQQNNYQPGFPQPAFPQPAFPHPAFPQPAHRNNEPNKPFGFQPFPTPAQPAVFNSFKIATSPKKFNKNLPGLSEFNLPGKYFQEHQFGANHGPEFSSAIVPAEHNIKQSKPKDTLLEKPVVPTVPAWPQLGGQKQGFYGFAPPPSFGYAIHNFPSIPPFFSSTPASAKFVPTTASSVPMNAAAFSQTFNSFPAFNTAKFSQSFGPAITSTVPSSSQSDESVTSAFTDIPLSVTETTAADPQPIVTTASVIIGVAPTNDTDFDAANDAVTEQQQIEQFNTQSSQSSDPTEAAPASEDVSSKGDSSTSTADEVTESFSFNAPSEMSNDPNESTTVGAFEETSSEKAEQVTENSPTEVPNRDSPQFINDPFGGDVGSIPGWDKSVLRLAVAPRLPHLEQQSANPKQPSYFDAPKFSEEELKAAFISSFGSSIPPTQIFVNGVQQKSQVLGTSGSALKATEGISSGAVTTKSSDSTSAVNTPFFGNFGSYLEAPKFSEEELKAAFEASFGSSAPQTQILINGVPQNFQTSEITGTALKNAAGTKSGGMTTKSGEPVAAVNTPYFGNFGPYFDSPKFSEEELKAAFAASFGNNAPSGQFLENQVPQKSLTSSSGSAPQIANGVSIGDVSTENNVLAAAVSTTPVTKIVESGEKKEAVQLVPKSNTVQIIQDDPFNGQLPLLYDPSNSGSPLDTYRFYNHPSITALSSKATLASYSPEDAFTNFGTQFNQGYLVEGSPSLMPVSKDFAVQPSSGTPISISSKDHPLHSQVYKFTDSYVPYQQVAAGNTATNFRSFGVPSSPTAVPVVSTVTSSTAQLPRKQ